MTHEREEIKATIDRYLDLRRAAIAGDRPWRDLSEVFTEDAVAAFYCATDRNTPTYVRAVLFGALAYFVMPADLIPDFIAGLGFTDDAVVFYTALRTIAPHIQDRHYAQARRALARLETESDTES